MAAAVAGVIAIAGIFVFRADARYIYDGLVGEGLPLVIASLLCGGAVLVLLYRGVHRGLRPLAVARPDRDDLGLGGGAVPVPAPADADDRRRAPLPGRP